MIVLVYCILSLFYYVSVCVIPRLCVIYILLLRHVCAESDVKHQQTNHFSTRALLSGRISNLSMLSVKCFPKVYKCNIEFLPLISRACAVLYKAADDES